MFTGIIIDVGEVLAVERAGDLRARIATALDVSTLDIGASVACDGVCLTVVAKGADPRPWFEVQVSAETVARTAIGPNGWPPGRRVNLERALRVGDELGGHIVAGHVDGVAEVTALRDEGSSTRVTLRAPPELARFIASKGSVALDGISLTVNEVDGAAFGVNLIPHTKAATTWGRLHEGQAVNLEVDTMARYGARLGDVA